MVQFKYVCNDLSELPALSEKILQDCKLSKIFTFTGNLGAGKTTLIKSLCAHLGYKGEVTSPTFSVINEYANETQIIYHMDLYRLKKIEEALDIGLEEYLYSGQYCFIEWPQIAEEMMDESYYAVNMDVDELLKRKIEITFVA